MPKRIEKYQLGKTLGSGTFSKVKYAVDTVTNKPYACKIIDRKMIKKENMEAQLKKEIAIMKILKHRHVVELKEVLQSNKHIYIILELITGGELFDRIVSAKRFSEKTARRYFQQLIKGVHYCHNQGIAHRDLKPENLLLDDQDNLKISDYGLSALSAGSDGRTKLLKTTCGTPNYVSPEVLKEQGYGGFKSDVWSCGVILYVMLAGYLPFEDETMSGLFGKIENGDYKFPSFFTLNVRKLIAKMLTVNPNKRISVVEIMENQWFKVGFRRDKTVDKIKISKSQVKNSIQGAEESENGNGGEGKSSKSKVPRYPHSAFDLLSSLMGGALNPLMSPEYVKIKRETRFAMDGDEKKAKPSLVKALKTLKANPKFKGHSLKGFVHRNKALITFSAEVQGNMGGFSMVEVRRKKGDILAFNQFYRELLVALGKQVISVEKLES